jgi:hypothetical protein
MTLRPFGHHLRELPGNIVQMYIRDPAGNMIEVNCPDAALLNSSIQDELHRLSDLFPQYPTDLKARLYLEPRARLTPDDPPLTVA